MTGWSYYFYLETDASWRTQLSAATEYTKALESGYEKTDVSWGTDAWGIEVFEELERRGTATCLAWNGGYPAIYVTAAGALADACLERSETVAEWDRSSWVMHSDSIRHFDAAAVLAAVIWDKS